LSRTRYEAQAFYRRTDHQGPAEGSWEFIGQIVETSISGYRVSRALKDLLKDRSKPKSIVCDNGTEFISKAMYFWAKDNQVQLSFIQLGKSTKNAFVESFNGKFRDNCLNQHWFRSLDEAREMIESWRKDYNGIRTHIVLGYQPPVVFAKKIA